MMYRCVVAYGAVAVGDLVEVPDGAAVSPYHLEAAAAGGGPPASGAGDGPAGGAGQSGALSAPSDLSPKAGV